jgi:triosephosphate isomerase
MKYVIANWKMSLTPTDGQQLLDRLPAHKSLVICPSYPQLSEFRHKHPNHKFGAQDVSAFNAGAYTGEVGAQFLKELGVHYVIIGHNERRTLFSETADILAKKLENSLNAGLTVIFCVGETKEQRPDYTTILAEQLAVLKPHPSANIIVAYEPVWSIGTGIQPTPEEIFAAVGFIKELTHLPVVYGGSVNGDNIAKIAAIQNLDGVLVGSASTKYDELSKILKVICQ